MKQTLLLAENDAGSRETWSKILSRAGYDVRQASSPEQVQALLRNTAIDLAILDLRLLDDNDGTDLSGLEIVLDRAFRHIPKILLTAFPVSYEHLRRALGPTIDDLPPAVAFVDKSEGPEALLAVIRRTFEAWPRLRMSAIRVSAQIRADHDAARRQAHISYRLAFVISIFAFLVICAGISLSWLDGLAIAVVGTASGILLESLSYLFLRRADRANDRMDAYHRELVQTYWLELLLAAAEQLPSARKVVCTEQIICAAAGWFAPQAVAAAPGSSQPPAL